MPWDVTYYDDEPDDPEIGDMWAAPDWEHSNVLSEGYKSLKISRPPLMVMLPNNTRFLIDRSVSEGGHGWQIVINNQLVDGQKLNITLSPSIHCVGKYHGYIKNGVITDDVNTKTVVKQ